jgi:hypothetical protein
MKRARQRDLDLAVVKAAPKVCAEIIKRLRAASPAPTDTDRKFVLGHQVRGDQDIEIVEKFAQECS